jgi:DNA-binding HxlR family transcriptional regulator
LKLRSGCPINLSVELLGDGWTMVIVRDIMFGNFRTYRELLTNSLEGIASNILADRLKSMVAEGLLTKAPDPDHKQRAIFSLTEKAIQLVPLIVQLGAWGRRHLPATEELSVRAQLLEESGPAIWEDFMDDLRALHLGAPGAAGRPLVIEQLQTAYEAKVAGG